MTKIIQQLKNMVHITVVNIFGSNDPDDSIAVLDYENKYIATKK